MAKPRKIEISESRITEAEHALSDLGFSGRQASEIAALTLLALLNLRPSDPWSHASDPLMGITMAMHFMATHYGKEYAPNTRETVRDEAVKYFVAEGLLLRNPDDPERPTNSGKTVYQIEPHALRLLKSWGTLEWSVELSIYLAQRNVIKSTLNSERQFSRIPVTLPNGSAVTLSPGGQNLLLKKIIEDFCPRFVPGGTIWYIGDAESKSLHLENEKFSTLGIALDGPVKLPDIIVFDQKRKWLILIEAVASAGSVDGKRRLELKEIFRNQRFGLVFVTAFLTIAEMRRHLQSIAWETEVWIAENPDHMIHFNGERFLGPYPDAMPTAPAP